MEDFSLFLPFITSLIISTVIWIICAVVFLSSGIIGTDVFGPVNNPLSESVRNGVITGLLHGLILGLIIYWYKPNSVISGGISSVGATEILLLIALIVGFTRRCINQPISLGIVPPFTYHDVLIGIYTVVFWFIILSIVFLIPSAIVGVANQIILNLFTPIQLK